MSKAKVTKKQKDFQNSRGKVVEDINFYLTSYHRLCEILKEKPEVFEFVHYEDAPVAEVRAKRNKVKSKFDKFYQRYLEEMQVVPEIKQEEEGKESTSD